MRLELAVTDLEYGRWEGDRRQSYIAASLPEGLIVSAGIVEGRTGKQRLGRKELQTG